MLLSSVFAIQNPRLFTLLALSFEGLFSSPKIVASCPALPRNFLVLLFHSPTSLNHLESTLMKYPVSVASKDLTESLNSLESTLTKNRGRGCYG
jgi:hypothetical protein